jgi:hypothetical protein
LGPSKTKKYIINATNVINAIDVNKIKMGIFLFFFFTGIIGLVNVEGVVYVGGVCCTGGTAASFVFIGSAS